MRREEKWKLIYVGSAQPHLHLLFKNHLLGFVSPDTFNGIYWTNPIDLKVHLDQPNRLDSLIGPTRQTWWLKPNTKYLTPLLDQRDRLNGQ